MIENTPVSDQGFLFIQFGANDRIHNISQNDFKTNLRFYRNQALALDITPVFITPVDSRAPGDNRGNYPDWMIEVAEENLPAQYTGRTVYLLDLHQRSLDRFGSRSTINPGYAFDNAPYLTRSGNFQRMDTTHFEQRGAVRVAGWIRNPAGEATDPSLCALFKKTIIPTTPTIYFTGEYKNNPNDPEINGWYIANPDCTIRSAGMDNTVIINTIHDQKTAGTVLAFNTYVDTTNRLLEHGFHNSIDAKSWANTTQSHIGWDALFSSDTIRIYVEVTTTRGDRHLTYKPIDKDEDPGATHPEYIRFGLGSDATDGTWKRIQRDLAADLKRFEPGNALIQVNGIRIRGTGRIDNLQMY